MKNGKAVNVEERKSRRMKEEENVLVKQELWQYLSSAASEDNNVLMPIVSSM